MAPVICFDYDSAQDNSHSHSPSDTLPLSHRMLSSKRHNLEYDKIQITQNNHSLMSQPLEIYSVVVVLLFFKNKITNPIKQILTCLSYQICKGSESSDIKSNNELCFLTSKKNQRTYKYLLVSFRETAGILPRQQPIRG